MFLKKKDFQNLIFLKIIINYFKGISNQKIFILLSKVGLTYKFD
jgi:hypothetical protein